MIVLDASAVVEIALRSGPGARIAGRIAADGGPAQAPQLLDLEVIQVLRRYAAAGLLPQDRIREAVRLLADLPIRRHGHEPFLGRVWELRESLTAYDAIYVAMAETFDATLLTRDQKLALAPGHRARIVVA